jgi:hypothetical protein
VPSIVVAGGRDYLPTVRVMKALPSPNLYIGRGTPLGNPYTAAEHGERALTLYAVHLWRAVYERQADILAALNSIGPACALVCSCAPRPCHGDVVLGVAWLAGKGEL